MYTYAHIHRHMHLFREARERGGAARCDVVHVGISAMLFCVCSNVFER